MSRIGRETSDIDLVRLNEAAPVIGDTAMETLTETVITDSSMIGHNPSTPAGAGQAVGEILLIENISRAVPGTAYILAASSEHSYEEVAAVVNQHEEVDIVGIILQADEAVLVENRIRKEIPIIDEVRRIDRLPDGVPCCDRGGASGADDPHALQSVRNRHSSGADRRRDPDDHSDRQEPDRQAERCCPEDAGRKHPRKRAPGRRDLFLRR